MEDQVGTYQFITENGSQRNGMAMVLKPQGWKHQFVDYEYQLMICRGLNYCTKEHSLTITGYYLTHRELFLVTRNTEEEWESIYREFNWYISKELRSQEKWQKALKEGVMLEDRELQKELDARELFELRPLLNHAVIRLLIKEPLPEYYDPQVSKIKEKAKQSQFSSISSEIKGPVIVSKKGS